MLKRIFYIFLISCLWSLILGQDFSHDWRASNCKFEPLPTSFNSPSYLNFNNEFHLQGEYFVNITQTPLNIPFNLTVESTFKLYVAPHIVDVDLYLWKISASGEASLLAASIDIGTEESIFKSSLDAGSYRLDLNFFGYTFGHYNPTQCDTITVEMAIAPRSTLISRAQQFTCPAGPQFPTIDFDTFPLNYNSLRDEPNVVMNLNYTTQANIVKWAKSYQFTIPSSLHTLWNIEAIIGGDFFTAGSLGIMLQPYSNDTQPQLSCFRNKQCTLASNSRYNEVVLQSLITPGDYVLWIYENLDEKDSTILPCSPFTFSLAISNEGMEQNYITCQALDLPDVLSPSELDEPNGFVHFSGHALLNLEGGKHVTTFSLTSPSFFKVFTSPHRVDVDLKLVNADTGALIEQVYHFAHEEEVIAVSLPIGNYNLSFIYFGSYVPKFCETFYVEMALSPQSFYPYPDWGFCYEQGSVLNRAPDLSSMQSDLDNGNSFDLKLMDGPYFFNYLNDRSKRTFLSQNFTITVESAVFFDLGDNFLLGDLHIGLDSFAGRVTHISGRNEQNRNYIRTILSPGTYQLVIGTGPSNHQVIPSFPPCAEYSLVISIQPLETVPDCWEYDTLPESLNTVSYLGLAQVVHVAKKFGTPYFLPGENKHSEDLSFTVKNESFFRIWTEPHIIDIDFILKEDGRQVASALRLNVEEELMYVLQPNKQYVLTVNYWHWERADPHYYEPQCFEADLEFAISPVSPNGLSCAPKLPPSNFISSANGTQTEFFTSDEFYFTQTATSRIIDIPFVSTVFTLFRASIEYDFVWTDVSLNLIINNDTYFHAENRLGSKDLNTQILPPGYYTLRIYEPASMILEAYRRCSHFKLTVGWMETDSSSSGPSDLLGCRDTYFPPTFSSLPYLSFTQGQVHFHRNILVDVGRKRDWFEFNITTPSLFSIYIPNHNVVDVDLSLNYGTIDNMGNRLDYRTGYGEEAISYNLSPGQYILTTHYYGFYGSPLPSASSCVYFPAEISIIPNSVLESVSSLTTPCQSSVVPSTLVVDVPFENTFFRSLDSPFQLNLTFQLAFPALFDFNLRYEFTSGLLSMKLDGLIDEGLSNPVPRTYFGQYGYNHLFLHQILPKGQYNLTIYDPRSLTYREPNLHCSQYQFSYLLNSTDLPTDICNYNTLPTDLFSAEGGSASYGGPQNADGSVRIFANNFPLTTPGNLREHYILFKITEPSFMRIFVHTISTNDIDFYVYKNASRSSPPIYYSLGVETIETKLLSFEPQEEPYLLSIYYFRIDTVNPCPRYSLEIAIKTSDQLQNELLCPQILPDPEVPPPVYDITGLVWEHNENYYFTNERIQGNTYRNRFTYRILLNVLSNSTLYASVGFDFLANDFRVILRRAADTATTLAVGFPAGSENQGTYINFYNGIFYSLVPGRYYLDIQEDLSQKALPFPAYCHRFGFFMMVIPTSNNTAGTVLFVTPPGGENIDPDQDLTITIEFSEYVAVPSPSEVSLPQWISNNQAVFLYSETTPLFHVTPINAVFNGHRTILSVVFSKTTLQLGETYNLVINSDAFKTSKGTPFILLGQPSFVYKMHNCDCHGHGECSAAGKCVCDPGYAGQDCNSCAPGYHGAGIYCVENINCTENTCNGHGVCDDSDGTPHCRCDDGFTSTDNGYCSACALGYSDYPDCTIDDEVEGNRCSAPLLPTTFDEIAYLGFNQQMHIQAEYYIDVDHSSHEITFSLTQESVFRLYAEPHWVDVDVWLYRIDGTRQTVIDYAIKWNEEEVIFRTLPGGNPAAKYKLKFNYYLWNAKKDADCETFNLEIAISPITVVQQDTASISCSGQLPDPLGRIPGTYIPLPDGWTYNPGLTLFSVTANQSAPVPNFFYGFDFQVNPPKGKVALFQADLAYQFLPSDLSLMLEAGTQRNQCGNKPSALCVVGSNSFNRNHIAQLMPGGNYTLWIYEPEPQNSTLTACAAFEFFASLKFVPLIEDVYYCKGSTFPASFNSPGYLDFDGSMHIQELFLLLDAVEIPLEITVPSVMRITGSTPVASSFALYKEDGTAVVISPNIGYNPSVFANILPGKYVFKVISFFFNSYDRCPTVDMEMVISPSSTVYNHNCPGAELLPSLGTISVPYSFPANPSSSPTSYFAFTNNNVIRQWTFNLDEPAYLYSSVTSHFLTAGLFLELEFQEQAATRSIFGFPDYNQNVLRETLDRGSYTLKLRRSNNNQVPPINFPPCAEFNFEFKLQNLTQAAADPCQKFGEPLPSTFNSIRFLGLDGDFDYQSSEYRVPAFSGHTYRQIPFSVKEASILRIYTEPHVVDIDIVLYNDQSSSPIAHGGYTFNNEESIVYALQPNVNYTLRLLFWKWVPDVPSCPVFNMEIVVSKPHILNPLCVVDNWPQAPPATGMPETAYFYDSLDIGKTLNFQQRANQLRSSPVYPFRLDSSTNFYARLGFDFLSGNLVLKLKNKDTQTVHYGENTLNGYVLKLASLAAGNYELTIYEPLGNLENLLGCSYFTFELYIEADTIAALIPPHPFLPSNLGSIAYLSYDQQIHLHDDFTMFDGHGANQDVSFTLTKESLVRISTAHYIKEIDGIQINIYQGDEIYSSHIESMVELMPPGNYYFNLRRPYNSNFFGTIYPSIEVAISPSTVLTHDLQPFNKPCTDSRIPPIAPNPQGLYIYNDPNLSVTMATLQSRPVLQTLSFVLTVPSLVYIQAQYQFLITPLQLNITGYSSTYDYVSIVGINYRNLNSINDLLPAGTYTLSISQPNEVIFPYGTQFPHCGPYGLKIFIRNAHGDSTHVDCSVYSVVPWNLDTASGGSVPYGGPIDRSGSIHMAGENFIMPDGDKPTDKITFNVVAPSYFVVVTRESYYGDITIALSRGSSSIKLLINPVNTVANNYQRASQFFLETPGPHELQLHYERPDRYSCPYFGLQILLEPIYTSGNRSTCDSNITPQYPSRVAVLNNGTFFERVDSVFPSSFILQNMVDNQFIYDINITVPRTSRVVATLGFNALTSLFNMQIFQQLPAWTNNVAFGEYRMQRTRSGATNLNQVISGILRAGNYNLRMSALFDTPLIASQLCYPFIFSLLVLPNDGSTPSVNNISPPGGEFLSPSEPVSLTIDFSTDLYQNGSRITNDNPSVLYPAFSLVSSQNVVHCTIASQLSSLSWKFIFSGPFYPSYSYVLKMDDSILKDSNGHSFKLFGESSYVMLDVSCNNRGEFDSGHCYCDTGYAGRECETCEVGYKLRHSNSSDQWECAQCTSPHCGCFVDSCSCEPGIKPCEPLGTCREDANYNPTCSCLSGYGGAFCEMCAAGYENYPFCDKTKVCPPGTAGPECEPITNGQTTYASIEVTRYIFASFAFAILIVTVVFIIWKRFLSRRTQKGNYGSLDETL